VSTFLFLVFFSIPAIFGLSNTLIIKIIFFKLVDYYRLVDDHLGSGAYASVKTAINLASGEEYAVKVVNKHKHGHTRSRIMREVQIFKLCRNHPNIGIYFCLHLFWLFKFGYGFGGGNVSWVGLWVWWTVTKTRRPKNAWVSLVLVLEWATMREGLIWARGRSEPWPQFPHF